MKKIYTIAEGKSRGASQRIGAQDPPHICYNFDLEREGKMKTIRVLIAAMAMVILLFAAESLAQRGGGWRGSGGWGMGGKYCRMYDPKTVETISGEVLSVTRVTPMKGMSKGVHLLVKTDKENISVHLGPTWFIDSQDVKIERKDRVEVKGSRITFEGKPAIIAAELTKGNQTLKLRDENGIPVWSGWRRR